MAGKPTLTIRAIERGAPGSFYDRTRLKQLVRDRDAHGHALKQGRNEGTELTAYLDAELALIDFIKSRAETSDGSAPDALLRLLSEREFDDLAAELLGNRPAPSANGSGPSLPAGPAARRRPRGGSKSS